ncbi:uncharacterized protein F4812DRAFT_466525 [Daldinia caldariorum]|uniref:uncharacterized protein n=1 Tax=Daldinia caldariorum TaxID=326644 RepID=UPI0020088A30|nr:uncharacterized protein F4812DRAFT_466525 [Daldinia caldariorum]KAI1465543.1 hypothetical protein F4812DRAFT_466525 [Daldinia caldariorum]
MASPSMASIDSKEGRDRKPSQSISQPQASGTGRNLTHRRPRFTNLDEAHRNITSKHATGSSSELHKFDEESEGSRDGSQQFASPTEGSDTCSTLPQHEFPPNTITSSTAKPFLPFHVASTISTVAKLDMPEPKREPIKVAETLNHKPSGPKMDEYPNESGSTVEKIVDHYANHTLNGLSTPRAATRCGFRGEETRPAYRRYFQDGLPASNPPQGGLPDIPLGHSRSRSVLQGIYEKSSPITETTISNSQHLLDAEAQASELRSGPKPMVPSPLRLPLERNPRAGLLHSEQLNNTESSFNDMTTSSNNDPFRYDQRNNWAAITPWKEKEISQALRRVSKDGGPSGATIFTPEGSPRPAIWPILDPALNRAEVALKSKRPEGQFFHKAALQSVLQADSGDTQEVKIMIGSPPEPRRKRELKRDRVSGSIKDYIQPDDPPAGLPLRDSTANQTWVTDGYSDIIKVAGSSIADYSDDDDDEQNRPSLCGSSCAIIQHPLRGNDSGLYEVRTLKDAKRSVLLPKTRLFKGGTFQDNSSRYFSGSTSKNTGFSQLQPFTRGLSNPFGKKEASRNVNPEEKFSRNFMRNGPSKYDFRDSISEYSARGSRVLSGISFCGRHIITDVNEVELQDFSKRMNEDEIPKIPGLETTSSKQPELGSTASEQGKAPRYESRLVDRDYPIRYGNWFQEEKDQEIATQSSFNASFNGELISPQSKFEFELLPLDEAQRKNKQQRESGEKDETESPLSRTNFTMTSWTNRGPSASPVLQLPRPAHIPSGRTAPHLSLNFSPSTHQSSNDAFEDTPTPFSATSHRSSTPTPARPARALLYHNTSSESPTTTGTFKKPKRSLLGRFVPRMFSSEARSRRTVSTNTVIQNPTYNDSRMSLDAIEALREPSISRYGRIKRAQWFTFMAVMSIIIPFFAILVLTGALNKTLVWYSNGEVGQIRLKQRTFIKGVFLAQNCIYALGTSCLIAVFARMH